MNTSYKYINYSFNNTHEDYEEYSEKFINGFLHYIDFYKISKSAHLNILDKYIYWSLKTYKYEKLNELLDELSEYKFNICHLLLISINIDDVKILHYILENYININSCTYICDIDNTYQKVLLDYSVIVNNFCNNSDYIYIKECILHYTFIEYVINLNKLNNNNCSIIYYLITHNNSYNINDLLSEQFYFYKTIICYYPICIYECMYQNHGILNYLIQDMLHESIDMSNIKYIYKFIEQGVNIWNSTIFNNSKLLNNKKFMKSIIKNTINRLDDFKIINALTSCIKMGYDDYSILIYKIYKIDDKILIANLIYYSRLNSLKKLFKKININNISESEWIDYLFIATTTTNKRNIISIIKLIINYSKLSVDKIINLKCNVSPYNDIYSSEYNVILNLYIDDNNQYDDNYNKFIKPYLNLLSICKDSYKILKLLDIKKQHILFCENYNSDYYLNRLNMLDHVVRWGDYKTYRYLMNKISIDDIKTQSLNQLIYSSLLNNNIHILKNLLEQRNELYQFTLSSYFNYYKNHINNFDKFNLKNFNKKINILKKYNRFNNVITRENYKIVEEVIRQNNLDKYYLIKFIVRYTICVYDNETELFDFYYLLENLSANDISILFNSNLMCLSLFELINHLVICFNTFYNNKTEYLIYKYTKYSNIESYLFYLKKEDQCKICKSFVSEINMYSKFNYYDFMLISNFIDISYISDKLINNYDIKKYIALSKYNFYKENLNNTMKLLPFYNALYKINKLIKLVKYNQKQIHTNNLLYTLNEIEYSVPNNLLKRGGVKYRQLVINNYSLYDNELKYEINLYQN
jgi:hypothetical protein